MTALGQSKGTFRNAGIMVISSALKYWSVVRQARGKRKVERGSIDSNACLLFNHGTICGQNYMNHCVPRESRRALLTKLLKDKALQWMEKYGPHLFSSQP